MPEDLPTPKKSLKQLEKENNKRLKPHLVFLFLVFLVIENIFLSFLA